MPDRSPRTSSSPESPPSTSGEHAAHGTCGQPVQEGPPGGIRVVRRCGRTVEREGLCRDHLNEQAYQHEQFRQMMENATAHSPSVAVHGKGQSCCCGAFVKKGEEHPWNLNHADEVKWWAAHPTAPHRPDGEPQMLYEDIKGEGYDLRLCLSEPLTEGEREALHEYLRTTTSCGDAR